MKQAADNAFHLHRLNIGSRLTLCCVSIILAMLVGNAVLLWQFHLARAQTELLRGVDQEAIAVLQAHTNVMSFYERLDALAQSQDTVRLVEEVDSLRTSVVEETRRSRAALSRLPPTVQLDPTVLPTLEAIQEALPEQLEAIAALAKSSDWGAVRLRLAREVRPLEYRTSTLVQNVDHDVSEQRSQAVARIEQVQQRMFLIVPTTAVLTLLIAAFLGLAIRRSITQPLAQSMEGSKALARGEFEYRVAISGEDELAHLGRVFNDTAGRLRDLYATIQASEDRLRVVINTIPAHVWSARPDGSVDFISERWRESTGVSVKEGLGWGWGSVIHPDDLTRFVDEWHAALATGQPMESEARLRRADGEYHWWLIRNVPLRDELGRIVQWYGTSIDIEDRKRAEETVRRNERELRQLVEVIPQHVIVLEPNGSFLYVNQVAREYTGLALEDNVATDALAKIFHPDDLESVLDSRRRGIARGEQWEVEGRIRRKDGEYRWFLIRVNPLRDEQGRILRWYGTRTDIEDRKLAEDRLQAAMSVRTSLAAVRAEVAMALARKDTLREILHQCAQTLVRHLDAAFARIWTLKSGGAELELEASAGMYTRLDGRYSRIPVGHIKIGLIAQERKPHLTNDVQNDPRISDHSWARAEKMQSFAGIPLLVQGRVVGVIGMFSRQALTEGTLETLAFIADGIAQGIDRKGAEDALRRSEAYLAESQRLTQTGSWALNTATGKTIYWSQEMFRIFAFDPQEGLPSLDKFRQRVHPEDRHRFMVGFEKAVREKADFVDDQRIVLPDGQMKYIRVTGHPVLEETGELVEYVGTAIDVTDRKYAEEELRAAETRFRTFVDHAIDALFVDDEQGRIIDVNRRACESLGYTREELLGMTPRDFDLSLNESFRQLLNGRLAAGETIALETSYRRKDGTEFPVELRGRPFWHGGHRFALALARDITERKRAEEERERLRQTQADLQRVTRVTTMGELTASLAHEINQPIAAAITNSNTCLRWLKRDPPDVEEAREAASRTVQAATRAAEIIKRIRTLFKKGTPQGEPVDLNEVIRDMVALLAREADRHGVSIRTDLADDLPKVIADPVQLQQVFMNLMVNSMEAMRDMRAERELVIKSERAGTGHLLISVSDTGVGLAPQQTDEIFNAFFTTKPEGTGMGLTISRSIIESHGGRLWATAKTGRGATFQFTLPSQPEETE